MGIANKAVLSNNLKSSRLTAQTSMTTSKKNNRPTNLLSIQENQARKERPMTGIGIWRLGFRPFYLGAAFFSGTAVMLWLGALFGIIEMPETAFINPLYWHAHEMVFGFAIAVIAGFLLTASNNWTGILPAAGVPLALLFSFWLIARIFITIGNIYLAAAFDLIFEIFLCVLLFRVLCMAKLWKNFLILGLVFLMGGLNAWFYSIVISGNHSNPLYPVELALLVIMLLLIIMGGRVIPMFTQNGVPGIQVWKPSLLVSLTPALSALGIVAWLKFSPDYAAFFCLLAALINSVRFLGWKPWATLKHPMVWVLHLGYAWIPLTFLFMSLESFGLVARSLPIHALSVGAMGLIIAGMITRTAMGHTGRMISPSSADRAFFIFLTIAGFIRIVAATPMFQGERYAYPLLAISGVCWAAGFMVYLFQYTPWLFRPRIDGRPG